MKNVITKTIDALQKEFPNKNIVVIPAYAPEEIICEVDPTSAHSDYSTAIVYYFGSSIPHYHKNSIERYTVEEGELEVVVNGEKKHLTQGESLVIQTGSVHSAKGNGVRLKVHSNPGWTPNDHIFVE